MTHPIPKPGRYREIETDYAVKVLGCVRLPARDPHRRFDTPLGTFWNKYEEVN